MKRQMRKRRQAQVWALFGYSVATMSIFCFSSGDGMWRKRVLSLAVMMLAALLATWLSVREGGACAAGSNEE